MVRPKDHGGRSTPKKGTETDASGRYTSPIPKEYKQSPPWVAPVMFALFGLGMVLIIVNYLGVLPGGADNVYLMIGLGLITAGFVFATQLR